MPSTAISAQGSVISVGTGDPIVYAVVGNVRSFSGFDGSASEIDTTNLSSTAKEFRLGLVDNGQFTMELDYDGADAGQVALRTAQTAGTVRDFKLALPNADEITFKGLVKKFSLTGGVDAVLRASVEIRITGAVTGL